MFRRHLLSQKWLCSMLGENRCTLFACHFSEARNYARSDGTGFAIGNQAPIGFDHGNDLGSRSCEETFIGSVNIVPSNVRLQSFEAEFGGNLKRYRTSNAAKCACSHRWRYNLPMLHA